jgi:hypothetical protein
LMVKGWALGIRPVRLVQLARRHGRAREKFHLDVTAVHVRVERGLVARRDEVHAAAVDVAGGGGGGEARHQGDGAALMPRGRAAVHVGHSPLHSQRTRTSPAPSIHRK